MENIGAWLGILRTITYFAVVLNVTLFIISKVRVTHFNNTQALIIAISSEFIQRLYYQHVVSPDGTQAGYVDFTLTGIRKIIFLLSHSHYWLVFRIQHRKVE